MAQRTPRFFKDDDFEFIFLFMLGKTYYHAADLGECLAIAGRIKNGDAESAFTEFMAAADRVRDIAETAEAASHRVSAREAYLRAANYYYAATYFVDRAGVAEHFTPTWNQHRDAWDHAAALFDPPVEKVEIPYEGTALQGYLFRVDESGARRPLLILNNGSDGSVLDMWCTGGAAGVARGYNCLTFDGPGQGAALHLQQLYFRPDWEKVITPVVDYALTQPDVDPDRIAIQGISQGGYWVPRAVAFEHRIGAAIADPGVWDVSASWEAHLPKSMRTMLAKGKKEGFNRWLGMAERFSHSIRSMLEFRMRPYGLPTPYDAFKAAERYTLDGVVEQIRCPMLITDPDNEQFWPGQPQRLYDALPGAKTLVRFTAEEGADIHCEPRSPGLRDQRVFDWLDETLK